MSCSLLHAGLEDERTFAFTDCELEELVPDGATVRITTRVQIEGRIRGNGNATGWFEDSTTI